MGKYTKHYKKITPFKYPNKIHIRTEYPPTYSDYKKYKKYLKLEFSNKCIYCRKSDSLQDLSAFHVEHYKPKKYFSSLETDYDNLLYSCAACNRYKSSYWSEDIKKQILNPCIHVMNDYVGFDKIERSKVIARNDQGELFIRLLRLNNNLSISYRKQMEGLIISLLKNLSNIDFKAKEKELNKVIGCLSKLIGEDDNHIKKALRLAD